MSHKFSYFLVPFALLISSISLYLFDNQFLAILAIGLAIIAGFQNLKLLRLSEQNKTEDVNEFSFSCRNQIFSSVDQLSAGIAHEINNPLGIIAQETQWLRHILKDEKILQTVDQKQLDDCEDSIREISTQVNRCNEIVQKLLSLARQLEPIVQEVEPNDVVLSVVEIVNREARSANINIETKLDDDLPRIRTDPPLLRQALLNLLVNARQAIQHDGEICVVTRKGIPNGVEIEIRDNGCGISPENLNRVFTPFFSTKTQDKGTGLGLAICRGIIERLGGEISVQSDLGNFTAFTVRLPVDQQA